MRTIHLDTKHQVYWLSYEYFLKHDISENTLSQWSKRDVCKRMYLDGRAYIKYDTIPEPTREKLPNKEELKKEFNRQRIKDLELWFTDELQDAYKSPRMAEYVNFILNDETYSKLKREQVTYFARRASVIERAVYIQDNTSRKGKLDALYYAYCTLYPNDYSLKNRFCMALKKAREESILSVAIDKRVLREIEPKYTGVYIGLAEGILSDKRGFDMVDCHEKLEEACLALNIEAPSFWWLREYYYKNRNYLEEDRQGKTAYEQENGLYAKIIPALNRNSQWQIDGWEIPIYGKRKNEKGGQELFFKYVLIAVMDAHSRKMIGYKVAESENTESILKALEIAVKNTGVVPYEIVADNHSFNKTCEAANLKAALDKIGVHWTVDSNPRRKAILERAFRTLGDKHFKKHYGYIGQGVKTKMKHGRTQQELIDEYTKNSSRFLTYEQITAIAMSCILEYNDKKRPSLKESPNTRYEKSEDKHSFEIDDFAHAALFYKQTELKVSHGQVTIKRGMYTYEYQLPSAFSTANNGKTVGVYYQDFSEVYLFDLETKKSICSVQQKTEIHGAMSDQSKKDTESFYKNAGRIKGNTSKSRKRRNAINQTTDSINPDAIDTLNKLKTPKDVVKQLEQDKQLRGLLVEQEVNPAKIVELPEVGAIVYKRPEKKENKSPFRSTKEIELGKIIIE